jgi:hypothetical protein
MAWTTPGTATAGEVLTAAFWNANVRDNFNAINTVGFLMGSANSAQTGSAGADMTYDAATLTVTAGSWLVLAALGGKTQTNADGIACAIQNITTSAEVTNSVGTGVSSSLTEIRTILSRPVIVTVTASTILRPRFKRSGFSTPDVPAGGAFAISGWIVALQVAL